MDYIYNENTNSYEIKEFNKTLEDCRDFIKKNALLNVIIQNDADKKAVKNSRTTIRKKKDEIATLRKTLNSIVMGKFNEQAKELEKELDNADVQLKAKIDEYEKKLGKPEKFTITISSYDAQVIEKIRDYVNKKFTNVEVK